MKNVRGREFGTPLTQRQFDILYLLADGETTHTIAEQMGIKNDTATVYAAQMRDKLGVKTNTHAVAFAYRTGMLPIPLAPAWKITPRFFSE